MKTDSEIKMHSIAKLFPMWTDEELPKLIADIKANGLRHPILMYEDKILDGRNRYLACRAADIEPRFEEFVGTEIQAIRAIMSDNNIRRHATDNQRADAVARSIIMIQKCQDKESKNDAPRPPQPCGEDGERIRSSGLVINEAKDAKVSIRKVEQFVKIQKQGVEGLSGLAATSKVTVRTAEKVSSLPKPDQEKFVKAVEAGQDAKAALADVLPAAPPIVPLTPEVLAKVKISGDDRTIGQIIDQATSDEVADEVGVEETVKPVGSFTVRRRPPSPLYVGEDKPDVFTTIPGSAQQHRAKQIGNLDGPTPYCCPELAGKTILVTVQPDGVQLVATNELFIKVPLDGCVWLDCQEDGTDGSEVGAPGKQNHHKGITMIQVRHVDQYDWKPLDPKAPFIGQGMARWIKDHTCLAEKVNGKAPALYDLDEPRKILKVRCGCGEEYFERPAVYAEPDDA